MDDNPDPNSLACCDSSNITRPLSRLLVHLIGRIPSIIRWLHNDFRQIRTSLSACLDTLLFKTSTLWFYELLSEQADTHHALDQSFRLVLTVCLTASFCHEPTLPTCQSLHSNRDWDQNQVDKTVKIHNIDTNHSRLLFTCTDTNHDNIV